MLFNVCTLYLLLRFTACGSHVLNYDSVTICDGMEKVVRCPNKENIHVLQGFYGKWKNHDCNGIKMDPPGTHTCSKDRQETTKSVRNICQGKNQCTFIADKNIYGDPCPESNAYLYITFFCMAPGKRIEHQKDKNNHEVVTVLTHGFLVSERKYTHPVESQTEKATVDRTVSEVTTNNIENTSPAEEKPTNEKSELERKITIPTASPTTDANSSDEGASSSETKSANAESVPTGAEGLFDRNTIPSEGPDNQTTLDSNERNANSAEQMLRDSTICNGQSKLFACLPGDGLKIHSAFYGKKTGQDCNGDLPFKDDTPQCSALDALSNVQESCDAKQTCLLFADENIYGKSLCPNVNKYLQIEYLCSPMSQLANEVAKRKESVASADGAAVSKSAEPVREGQKNLTVMVCNGERHAISCKRDVGMLILSAFYGKMNGKDCRGDIGYRDDIPDCVNPRALDSVKFLCENRKSCELASEKELFGDDTCAGVNKYLEVTYQC